MLRASLATVAHRNGETGGRLARVASAAGSCLPCPGCRQAHANLLPLTA